MKVGVLGGTFNPVHNGHIKVAGEAKKQLKLDEVIFMPARQSPLKTDSGMASPEHRLEMLRLAVADSPGFKVSTIEIDRSGFSYTVDTMVRLHQEYGPGYEFYFILGWDTLADIYKWREPGRLIELCYLVAAPRPGYTKPDLRALEPFLRGISGRVVFLDGPVVNISASSIRERIAQGRSVSRLVPASVKEYILEHKLYIKATGDDK